MAWYNPSTWTVVDNIQGQNDSGDWRAPTDQDIADMNAQSIAQTDAAIANGFTTEGGMITPTTRYPVPGTAAAGAPTGPTAAQIAEQNRLATIRSNLAASQAAKEAAARQGVTDTTNAYDIQSMDFANKILTGQEDINTGRVNNALNLRRTVGNIGAGIRQGLRSGGVTLANMNASDSGAADAMARAYGEIGNQQFGDASNEAALKAGEIDTSQTRLGREREEGERRLGMYVPQETGRIRNNLFTELTNLSNTASEQGVGGAIDMGIVERVIADAVAALSGVDARRTQKLAGAVGLTAEEINARAAANEAAGMTGTSPFGIPEAGTPVGQAGGGVGAPISQLPVFVRRRQTS